MSSRLSTGFAWPSLAVARSPSGRRGVGFTRVLSRMIANAWRRRQTRQTIAELDARMLKDIGASRSDARAEASKPFWRA